MPGRAVERGAIERHVAYLRGLDREGRLVLAGPFADHPSGMVVVRADDRATAEEIARRDPFVMEGHRTAEIRTWVLATRENGFLLEGP